MLLTTYLAVLSLMCCLGGVVDGAVTFVRSNADREVGLGLYTDWQPKIKSVHLQVTRPRTIDKRSVLPVEQEARASADSKTIGKRSVLLV